MDSAFFLFMNFNELFYVLTLLSSIFTLNYKKIFAILKADLRRHCYE